MIFVTGLLIAVTVPHESGKRYILPNYLDQEQVSLTHITAIGRILDEFNIMNKLDFRTCLERNKTLV